MIQIEIHPPHPQPCFPCGFAEYFSGPAFAERSIGVHESGFDLAKYDVFSGYKGRGNDRCRGSSLNDSL